MGRKRGLRRLLFIAGKRGVPAPAPNFYNRYRIARDMQPVIVEGTKDSQSATIAFKDVNITLIAPLMKALDDDDNVTLVRFIETHPELDDRKLHVEVRNGSALEAVSKAAQAAADYFAAVE